TAAENSAAASADRPTLPSVPIRRRTVPPAFPRPSETPTTCQFATTPASAPARSPARTASEGLGIGPSVRKNVFGGENEAFAASPLASQAAAPKPGNDLGLSFVNVAKESGLNAKTIFGSEHKNKYLLETTGCGVAFYDYDNDGWLDIFLVNGSRLEGFPKGQEPTSHLFKNNRDGTFTDVTAKAGVAHSGWGQGVCMGVYDNDG